MGLDNGVKIKTDNKEILDLFTDYLDWSNFPRDVIYWRKWWGIRNNFVGYLKAKYKTYDEEYHWPLDADDIITLKQLLKNYLKPNAPCISTLWSNDELEHQIKNDIVVCDILIKLFEDGRLYESDVIFYDSY